MSHYFCHSNLAQAVYSKKKRVAASNRISNIGYWALILLVGMVLPVVAQDPHISLL